MKIVDFIKSIIGDRKKLSIAVIVIIAAALPLTVFIAQKQQEIRQRAAGEQTAFFFSTGTGCSTPATTATFSPNTTTALLLCLNTNNTGINIVSGLDITITKGTGVSLSTLTDGVDGAKLQTALNKINPDGSLRLAKVDYNNTLSGSALNIGQITVTTSASGNGNISIATTAVVTSPTTTDALTVARPTLPYTIGGTNTPIPSPTLTLTPNPSNACPAGQGNYIAGRIFVDNGAGAHARNGTYESDESGFYSNGQSYDPNQPNYNSSGRNIIFITQMTGPAYYVGSAIVGTTDTNGCYLFQNLPGIQYQIEYHIPSGYVQTTFPGSIYVCHSQPYCQEWPSSNQYDFGLGLASAITPTLTPIPTRGPTSTPTTTPAPPHTISGNVFIDTNGNGVLDTGEAGYSGANLLINLPTQDLIYQTNTNSSGDYSFTKVSPGTKTITLNIPSGYMISNANNTNPRSVTVQTADVPNVNFGITSTAPNFTPVPRVSPTPTPGQGGTTQIALNIGLDGIWSSGDNTNPDPKDSTKNPVHTTRNVKVEIFNNTETLISTFTGNIQYSANTGTFTGTVALGQTQSGSYIVKVTSLGYLRKRLPGITNLVAGQTYNSDNSVRVNLTSGDLNSDNRIDLEDYNILDDCVFFHVNPSGACSQNTNYATISDLTDNGVKDILDYGLLVREFAHEGD